LLCGTAQAQDAATDPRVASTLRPVVISVTRGVEQRAFDTPASVDVVDAATIRNAGPQVNLSEALAHQHVHSRRRA